MDSFRFQLSHHQIHIQRTVNRLAARHGHGVVQQNLVGDVHARGHSLADGQQPRMEVGSVAKIDKDVLLIRKGRLPRPVGAFATHLGEGGCLPVHPLGHVVTTDACRCAAAIGHPGGGVVRTAGAEHGQPIGSGPAFHPIQIPGKCIQAPQIAPFRLRLRAEGVHLPGQDTGNFGHIQLAGGAEQCTAIPIALADDAQRRASGSLIEQQPGKLLLHEGPFLLHHQ